MGFSIKGLFTSIGNAFTTAVKDVEKAAVDVEHFVEKEAKVVSNLFSGPPKDTFEPAPPDAKDKYAPINEPLFNGVPTDDFRQGSIGDCYVLSALAAVALDSPETIEKNIKKNADGTYTVTFHEPPGTSLFAKLGSTGMKIEGAIAEGLDFLGISPPTSTVEITVDGSMPVDANGNMVAATGPELWPLIYEKAMAKLMGGYNNMGDGGMPALTLQLITGKPVNTHVNLLNSASSIYNLVAQAAAHHQPMTASTPAHPGGGLVGSHVYTVLGAQTVNGQQYIQVRNPWGGANNGVQLVPLAVFKANFTEVDVGNV